MPDSLIRPAVARDLDPSYEILDSAARWLQSMGINQWSVPYPRPLVETWIDDGVLHVCEYEGSVAGTIRILYADTEIWDDGLPAVYVHTLAVARQFAGRGLGMELLRYAENLGRPRGLDRIRLDCWSKNDSLRKYYLRAGFRSAGDVEQALHDRVWYASRFERPIA